MKNPTFDLSEKGGAYRCFLHNIGQTLKLLKNIFIFGILVCGNISAQNVVPNGSFENLDSCPLWFGEIELASPWFQSNPAGSSTDVFNSCTTNPDISTSANFFGFQAPFQGNGYAGFCPYNSQTVDQREYIEIGLTTTLIAGNQYRLRAYFSLANESRFAINRLGVVFSNDSLYSFTSQGLIDSIPVIYFDTLNVLADTLGWTLIDYVFTASGVENFMTIGNFFPDAATSTASVNSGGYPWAYYYVDSVSLTLDDTGIPTNPRAEYITVSSLLKKNDFFVAANLPIGSTLNIYDSRGRIAFKSENYHNELCANQLSPGMYLYEFILPNRSRKTGKLIVQ